MRYEKTSDLLHLVTKVNTVYSKETVNELIAEGWVLLAIASGQEQIKPNDYIPMFGYCLGKLKESE
jgi:hypothetical protein